jgi:hypothetical protein
MTILSPSTKSCFISTIGTNRHDTQSEIANDCRAHDQHNENNCPLRMALNPSQLPDRRSCNLFLFDHLKTTFQALKLPNAEDLRDAVIQTVIDIPPDMLMTHFMSESAYSQPDLMALENMESEYHCGSRSTVSYQFGPSGKMRFEHSVRVTWGCTLTVHAR